MKNTRFLIFPILLAFVFFSCDRQDASSDQDEMLKARPTSGVAVLTPIEDGQYVDLIAGQTMVVGKVYVDKTDGCVKLRYVTDGTWILSEVHVEIVADEGDFSMTNSGNPKIGNFPYSASFMASEEVNEWETECIPLPEGNLAYIAAHAVVCNTDEVMEYTEPDFAALCASIPDYAKMENLGRNGQISYNLLDVYESGDVEFDGEYDGWCIEPGVYLWNNEQYDVKLLCSLGDLTELDGRIITTNFDLINFILNQNYIGFIPEGLGAIKVEDVQMALWKLVKPAEWMYTGSMASDPARVAWILAQAAGHENYVPECGGVISVVLLPTEVIYQTAAYTRPAEEVQLTLITIPVPCTPVYNCETAWAKGKNFPGNSWAMYFSFAW